MWVKKLRIFITKFEVDGFPRWSYKLAIADTIGVIEATHCSAPKYTFLNKVNPGSVILFAEMMVRCMC
jgi:hypothetical protein